MNSTDNFFQQMLKAGGCLCLRYFHGASDTVRLVRFYGPNQTNAFTTVITRNYLLYKKI